MTTDPRETLQAEEQALEARERLARGIGRFWIALAAVVAVGIVVVVIWFVA